MYLEKLRSNELKVCFFPILEEKKWIEKFFFVAICYNLQQPNTNLNCWYSYTTNELANEEKDTNIAE